LGFGIGDLRSGARVGKLQFVRSVVRQLLETNRFRAGNLRWFDHSYSKFCSQDAERGRYFDPRGACTKAADSERSSESCPKFGRAAQVTNSKLQTVTRHPRNCTRATAKRRGGERRLLDEPSSAREFHGVASPGAASCAHSIPKRCRYFRSPSASLALALRGHAACPALLRRVHWRRSESEILSGERSWDVFVTAISSHLKPPTA